MSSTSGETFGFTVRRSTLEDGALSTSPRNLQDSTASDPGHLRVSNASEGDLMRPRSTDPSTSHTASTSPKIGDTCSEIDLSEDDTSTSSGSESDNEGSARSRGDSSSTPSMTPSLDMASPITRTRKAKATPRRDTPVVHLVGTEESTYKAKKVRRNVRFFVFTPQGRALSVTLDKQLQTVADLCAYASLKLLEQERVIVPRCDPFTFAYFLPSFADLEDLQDIRENDEIVLVTAKLEPGQVLNGLGSTRLRSHSISTLPSPRGGPAASEWSNIVPVVETSFHPSTKTLERAMTSESERFSKDHLKSALTDHRSRVRSSHIHDITQRIESFASVGDRACWTTYSAAPAVTTFDTFSGASPRRRRRSSDFNPTTPRGGIALHHSAVYSAQRNDSLGTPRSIESNLSGMAVTYFSQGTHLSPRSDYSGDSPRGSRTSSEFSSHYANSTGMSAQQLRHAFEWERSENEIRAVVGAQNVADKWGERDKSKKERSRLLTADEEREAKKLEKRTSKNKVDNRVGSGSSSGKGTFSSGKAGNFFSTGPQKGIIGALGTLPRSKPGSGGGGSDASGSSSARSSIADSTFDSPEDVLIDPSGKVLGLKIEKLLQRLTSDSFPAVSLAKAFLLTYRLYMTPAELLNALEVRWDADGPAPPEPNSKMTPAQLQAQQLTPSRLRLITLVKQWAFKHASEDFEDGVVRNLLFSFAAKMERSGVLNLTREVESALFKKRASVENAYANIVSTSAPTSSKRRSNRFSTLISATKVQEAGNAHQQDSSSKEPHVSSSTELKRERKRSTLVDLNPGGHQFSASMSDMPATSMPAEDEDSGESNPVPYVPPFGGEMFDFHPLELARQLTIIEKAYLDAIKPEEMLNLAWTKKNKEMIAPNVLGTFSLAFYALSVLPSPTNTLLTPHLLFNTIHFCYSNMRLTLPLERDTAMIRFSNYIVDWMCTEILKPIDALERAMVLNRFIYVGHYCMELNNFNGAVEVLSALRRSSIYRLRRSWNYLSDRAWNVFEQMELLFEPDLNYKNYRAYETCSLLLPFNHLLL